MNSPRNIAIVLLLAAAAGAASAQTTPSSDQTQAARTVVAGNTSAMVGARPTGKSARKQPAHMAQQGNHNHDSMTGGGPN